MLLPPEAPQLTIRPVVDRDRPVLRALFDDYLQALSLLGAADLSYPYFDLYFEAADRWAYFAEINGEIAGFAMINRHSFSGRGVDHAMAEFSMLPAVRGAGLGRVFAGALFARHTGVWELSVSRGNIGAWSFWRGVTAGFKPCQVIDDGEDHILRFETRMPGRNPA